MMTFASVEHLLLGLYFKGTVFQMLEALGHSLEPHFEGLRVLYEDFRFNLTMVYLVTFSL